MKTLTIIATYNEKDNIAKLIPKILAEKNKSDILIVDDNSPDGTGIFSGSFINAFRLYLRVFWYLFLSRFFVFFSWTNNYLSNL